VDHGRVFDWFDRASEGLPFLHEAVQVKNVWIPYGE
jgi:aldehyde dehydrogenase (NAD+)